MTAIDPVCGQEVSARGAYATESYGPLAFHFCSKECHDRFLADPRRYVSHDEGQADHVFTTESGSVQPRPWRDEGDLSGPPTKPELDQS